MSGEDAMRKFQREMRKLGLGVSIKAGDDEWVVITEAPCEHCGSADAKFCADPECPKAKP